ncbi:hypothetical protein ACFQ7N_38310 [Streptomyces niveus]|uniref:hypothetical protein n=1 Tax=Streptomyces niveus TaxID=193462 RepID=UPI0036CF1FB9
MSEVQDLMDLTCQTMKVQRMLDALRVSDVTGSTTPEKEREYRLLRAVVAQRHVSVAEAIGESRKEAEAEADDAATRLWKHDQLHRSSRGPVPANDPRWTPATIHAYVAQEAEADSGEENSDRPAW